MARALTSVNVKQRRLRELPPPAALRPFISTIWFLDAHDGSAPEPVVADGAVDLIVCRGTPVHPLAASLPGSEPRDDLGPVYVVGARLVPVCIQLQPGTHLAGIRFRPGGAYPFLGTELSALRDTAVVLANLWPSYELPALDESLDRTSMLNSILTALLDRLRRGVRQHPAVVAATAALAKTGGRISIPDVSRQVGLSERQLERLMSVQVGLAPKALARIMRVQRARHMLSHGAPDSLAELAHEFGFADQAHLTREFTSLLGMPPGQHRAAARRLTEGRPSPE